MFRTAIEQSRGHCALRRDRDHLAAGLLAAGRHAGARQSASAGRARRGDRLRHVVVHRPVLRRATGGRRPGRDRRLRRLRVPVRPALRPGRGHHPLRHDHRGAGRCWTGCAGRRRPSRSSATRTRRSSTRRPSWSCWTSPTSSRSCRPGSPRPRWPCCAPAWARTWPGDRRRRAGRRRAAADEELLDVEQFTFLGRGWTIGLAQEAGLKMREAAGAWTEAYPAMEYRHGPISITGPDRMAWMFGTAPAGLPEQVAATGGRVPRRRPRPDGRTRDRSATGRGDRRWTRASTRTSPRHLTRSVVLRGVDQ